MTNNNEISRRALLSSLGIVGGAGATLGGGTAAFLTDTEILAAVTQAGALDLLVEWDETTSEGTARLEIDLTDGGSGAETFVVSLPDEGTESPSAPNNPARGWLRTTCPTVDGEVVDATTYVTVSLYYACASDQPVTVDGTPLEDLSLLDFGNLLRNGTHLDSAECEALSNGCLQPESDLELRFEWEWDPPENLGEDVPGPITFDFDFVGVQCRHNETPTNPFPVVDPCVRDGGHAISFIAFCSESGPIEVSPEQWDVVADDEEGDPSAVRWETNEPVGYVAVYSASTYTLYDYRPPVERSSGVAETDDPDAAVTELSERGGNAEFVAELANSELDDTDTYDPEYAIKVECEDGNWEVTADE